MSATRTRRKRRCTERRRERRKMPRNGQRSANTKDGKTTLKGSSSAIGDGEESVNKGARREVNADNSGNPQSWDTTICHIPGGTWLAQIQHLPGSQLVTADYLSRHPVEAGLNQPFARGSVCNRFTGIQKSQAALGPIGECPRGSVESIQCSRQHVSNENKEEEEMHREAERETEDAAERAEERKHKKREDDAQGEQLSDWRWRGKREQGSPERSECRQQRQSPVLGHDNLPHPRRDVASAGP
ncbi:uncharacterized protein [Pleurodeles waltl]|uniref:uncharacterized protein isoform X1 n=1 Tax=Pleurodeles waltl TaxID=8319 RepID=UPI003709B425